MSDTIDDFYNEYDPDLNYFEPIISQNLVFSNYGCIDEFNINNQTLLNDSNFFSIFSQNIYSFGAHLDTFLLMFNENSMPDCFFFSETWHDGKEPIIIPGYNSFHVPRPTVRGGGVSIFIKNSINAELIQDYSYANETIEICTVKIGTETSHLFLCGLYRPHGGTIENFTSTLENIIESRNLIRSNLVILGDFNINLLSSGGCVDGFIDMMRSHHFLQTITDITHPATNNISTPSLIDHIWINNISNYNSGIIQSGITDHHTTYILVPFKHKNNSPSKIKISFRDCSTENQVIFENKLRDFNWDGIKANNPEIYAQNFSTSLNVLYKESFPLKTKFVTERYFNNPWYNNEVKKLSQARKNYHNLFLMNLVSREQYSSFRNKITALIRNYKEQYYNESFRRNFGNMKKTWKIIKELSKGKTKSSIEKIYYNGVCINESSEIAAHFNRFFTTIAHDLAAALPQSSISPYLYVRQNTHPDIEYSPVSPTEVSDIIKSLNTTETGVNEISVNFFKKYHNYFLQCLCDIINQCFSNGMFPDFLKNATVIPILKKGSSSDMTNYRPIALLPFISKIFEKCIFNRLSNYASLCNLLVPTQFGFRKNKSTQDAIILITEKIYDAFNAGNGSFNINIFIDFQKAFDTIDHSILMNKLSMYGITGIYHEVLKNYLSNRHQSVRIGDQMSPPLPITKGIPQGSILGSLLFLFYINCLPNVSNIFTSVLFADDLVLYMSSNNIPSCNQICFRELEKIFEWSASNKLSINFGRTKSYFMVHTYSNLNFNDFSISINGHDLENMFHAKYLRHRFRF